MDRAGEGGAGLILSAVIAFMQAGRPRIAKEGEGGLDGSAPREEAGVTKAVVDGEEEVEEEGVEEEESRLGSGSCECKEGIAMVVGGGGVVQRGLRLLSDAIWDGSGYSYGGGMKEEEGEGNGPGHRTTAVHTR